jgi:uncharacterized protein
MMEAAVLEEQIYCPECNNPIRINAKFCHKCGKKFKRQHLSTGADFNTNLTLVFGYYFSSLAFIVFLKVSDFQTGVITALISDIIFACITLGFVFHNFKEIKPLFSFKNISLKIILMLVGAELIFAFGVNSLTGFINESILNVEDPRYYYLYLDSSSPLLFTLISVAVMPGVFEELGFRGVVFNHLSKITGPQSVIIVSSALFAVIHLSVISLIWILPLGLLFAYFRNKYNTLWYGIIGHTLYNAFIVLIELISDGMLF